ncbi:MAG TPA: serine hydrolase [Longimicrobiales bacterium]|nr:serine hydrolase [Longimicrobiales bacterium]
MTVSLTRAIPFAVTLLAACAQAAYVTPSAPRDHAFAGAILRADSMLDAAVAAGQIPGAVLVVTRDGRIVHESAHGFAQLYEYDERAKYGTPRRLDEPRPMQVTTVFDLASVTKVMATTYAIMLLVDRGLIDVDAPVHRYLPDFRGAHFDSITVRHLLTHSAGLHQWQPIYYNASSAAEAYEVIRHLPLQYGVGVERRYSDLGFMLLGYIVEQVSARPLDAFLRDELYAPLGLLHTSFLPTASQDFAATSHGNPYERRMVHDTAFGYRYDGDPTAWDGWRTYTLMGEVNDGNAWYAHGGVAGHAGLFSTGRDLAVLLQLILQGGEYGGRRYIARDVVEEFTRRDRFGHGLGWQLPADAPAGSFAHSGFTGAYVTGVPAARLGIVLLTNRQNAGVNGNGYYPGVDIRDDVVRTIIDGALDLRRPAGSTP